MLIFIVTIYRFRKYPPASHLYCKYWNKEQMTKKHLFILAVVFACIMLSHGLARAMTVTAAPNPANVNQTLAVTVNASFIPGIFSPNCNLQINFGDSTTWLNLPTCTSDICVRNTTHAYSTPGPYIISARYQVDSCVPQPLPPSPASTNITVNPAQCTPLSITSPAVLGSGNVGQPYSSQFQASGGTAPLTFSLVTGSLPPGLGINGAGLITGTPSAAGNYHFTISAADSCESGARTVQRSFSIAINSAGCPPLFITTPAVLAPGTVGQTYSRQILANGGAAPVTFALASGSLPPGLDVNAAGVIAGTPTAAGNYSFAITAADSCGSGAQAVQMGFTIIISPPSIAGVQVKPVPLSFSMPRNSGWSQNIMYMFSTPSSARIILNSDKGVFRANNTVIGAANISLVVTLNNTAGNVSELLNIPVDISERAEQLGTARITYSRVFTDGLASVTAEVDITVTTSSMSEFRITRLRLYFENDRGEITVKRNQPALKTFADIRFLGSGLLKGHWEVDGRILGYVNQHLAYGTSLTLSSPEVPALPTYAPGTHVVRFVMTPLPEDVSMPQALYFVTADDAGEANTIGLVMPGDSSEIGYEPYTFGWKKNTWANTYLIEFFGEDSEKPIFSDDTRKIIYLLPPASLQKNFAAGRSYQWRVKGYDAGGNVVGESTLQRFTFSE